jgi:hypothetical protein
MLGWFRWVYPWLFLKLTAESISLIDSRFKAISLTWVKKLSLTFIHSWTTTTNQSHKKPIYGPWFEEEKNKDNMKNLQLIITLHILSMSDLRLHINHRTLSLLIFTIIIIISQSNARKIFETKSWLMTYWLGGHPLSAWCWFSFRSHLTLSSP